jgi:hypothetical protein
MKVYEEQPLYKSIMRSESGKKNPRRKERTAEDNIPEMQAGSFLQGLSQSERTKIWEQRTRDNLCYRCGGKGHKGYECTEKRVQYAQVQDDKIPVTEATVFSFMA